MIPNRVVIDTNVCLDLFVFRDRRYQNLLDALRNGRLQAVTSEHCRKEWLFILSYPHLPLDEVSKIAVIAEYDALITLLPLDAAPEGLSLPVCKDKEDQKFMELAYASKASLLLTKDKALLKLAKRTARLGLFAILSPDAWLHENAAA
jgi:putative PIN family toxin of toxin-antitoxin system